MFGEKDKQTVLQYLNHLSSGSDLITSYEARRAGFVALALEKNRRATPYVAEARALQQAVSSAKKPFDLLAIAGIESALLTASGLSDKSLNHLQTEDKQQAILGMIKNFLEPAGEKFIEELVYRFLLIRGDTLGGSMRNVGGNLAQRKLTRIILSTLTIAGIPYRWKHSKTRQWVDMSHDDSDIELYLRGLNWKNKNGNRTLIYNLTVPIVKNNVDLCLFDAVPDAVDGGEYNNPNAYLALGELKGGIDPAGADEHWKTAGTALDRIRSAFLKVNANPSIFFIGAAIEAKMAEEIWRHLENNTLGNAANLTNEKQLASIVQWLQRFHV